MVEGKAREGLELLRSEDDGVYGRALKLVHEDTRSWWEDRLEDGEADTQGRHLLPDAANLARLLEEEALPWIGRRRQELLHRPLIRSQLLGKVLPAHQLEKLARYEVHLDRKLQRLLGMDEDVGTGVGPSERAHHAGGGGSTPEEPTTDVGAPQTGRRAEAVTG